MIRVRLQAPYNSLAGVDSGGVPHAAGSTVSSLLEELARRRPQLAPYLRAAGGEVLVYVRGKPARRDDPVFPEDAVDVFPPLSGG